MRHPFGDARRLAAATWFEFQRFRHTAPAARPLDSLLKGNANVPNSRNCAGPNATQVSPFANPFNGDECHRWWLNGLTLTVAGDRGAFQPF